MSKFEQLTDDRFVAFFDIMGFKDFVYRNSHEDVENLMKGVCDTIGSIKEAETNFQQMDDPNHELHKGIVLPAVFSDSIVFISQSNTLYDARKILFASCFFLSYAMMARVPIKGGLSYGKFTADFEKSSFFGRPLIDAFQLSEEVGFYGAVLDSNFDRFIFENDVLKKCEELVTKKVPMKDGSIRHSYLNWTIFLEEDDPTPEELIQLFYLRASGRARKYVDNTMAVYV